jgi:Tfp pilus assembly protein PilX
MRRLLSRFLRRQDGVALPVVIGSLTVVTGLAVSTFAVSVQTHHASAHDRDSKRALAAAEAGLQMAILRTSDLEPNSTQCVTLALASPSGGECPWTTDVSIGNGATYRYVVATPTTGTCATVPGFTPTADKDRCITSIGTVNGVSRRLQMRFYYQPPFLPWGQAGLVGKNKVDIGNNKIIDSAIGTNGDVYLGNNSNAWELLLPQDAEYHPSNNATIDTEVAGGNAIRQPPVPKWEFPEIDWSTPQLTNNNGNLNGISGWDGKYMKLGQQQDITIPGGTYWMCGFDAPNGNTISVPAGQFVRLYIIGDNGNSSCNENDPIDGKFQIKNDGVVNPLPTTDPKAEQFALFVYGTDRDDENNSDPVDVDMNNGVSFWGTIWAPYSTIEIKNNQVVSGGFTGSTIDMKNNGGFQYDSDIANQSLPGTADAENLSWTECRKLTEGQTDPEAGCS